MKSPHRDLIALHRNGDIVRIFLGAIVTYCVNMKTVGGIFGFVVVVYVLVTVAM